MSRIRDLAKALNEALARVDDKSGLWLHSDIRDIIQIMADGVPNYVSKVWITAKLFLGVLSSY